MQKYTKMLLLFLFIFIGYLKSNYEIFTIKSVFEYIDPKKSVLIIVDIDNTLLQTSKDLDYGSDQWFESELQKNLKDGLSFSEAIQKILPLYLHINFKINLIPTEPTLAYDISEIRKKCDFIICLTARSFHLAERTLLQLSNNNLFFSIENFDELILNLSHPALYKFGVLFCGSNNKGDVIEKFLTHINYKPEVIIFIDDKEKNLYAVEIACKKMNIEFIGLRYSGCDDRVRNFNADKTQQDLEKFLIHYPLEIEIQL